MSTIRLALESLPPSDNNAYRTSRTMRRHLTKEAAAWKREVGYEWLAGTTAVQRERMAGVLYRVRLRYFLPLHYKNGKLRKWDVSSHQKLAVDAVADAICSDDARCLALVVTKEDATAPRTVIDIEALPPQ